MIKKTLYVCHKCDRVYYSVSQEAWDKDRSGHDRKAREARRKHMCPWERRKKNQSK